MKKKVLLVTLYLYAFIFSILRTLRLPNEWSEAHWMMDYRFGFIKRGLAGEIFGCFFEKNEFNILVLSAVILFLLYVAIFAIAVKETFSNENNICRILFYLIFFLSQYVVFTAHLIGYLDHIVFLLTMLIIFLIRRQKIFLASVLASLGILVHEISFFLMLPVCFFALMVTTIPVNQFSLKSIFGPGILKKMALLLVLPFLTTVSVSVYQELHGENYFSEIFNYLSHNSMVSQRADSVASAYTKSFSYYFSEESGHFFQRLFISRCTIFYGIPVLFSLWMMYKGLKINIPLLLLSGAVCAFPLLLHAIAWDTFRIWSFPFMMLFLCFWILSSVSGTRTLSPQKLSGVDIAAFIASFLLVTLIPNSLFDGEVERFSLVERLIILVPLCSGIYLVIRQSRPE
ncbi:hypothetical protein [Chryseobacterium gossypii]|uniref:hypothetical protein n=1 Tax=Chryseobacterium gossypii TaxID=3231602 RepID=UPI0035235AE3